MLHLKDRRIYLQSTIIALLVWIIAPLTPILAVTNTPPATAITGRYIVKFKTGVSRSTIDRQVSKSGATIKRHHDRLRIAVIEAKLPFGDVPNSLSRLPEVEYVEPDYIAKADAAPNDTNYATKQWGLENTGQNINGSSGSVDADIDHATVWNSYSGNGPLVAVLDSGIDQDHADLAPKIFNNYNATTTATVDDKFGHGTHVAGIIAAVTNNSQGVAGTCPNCRLLNVKVLDDNGYGAYSEILAGAIWAADNGAKVINMSFGGPHSLTLQDAVNYASSKGVVLVASAGNSSSTNRNYPAAFDNVIAVAATDNRDNKAWFTNIGADWVDLAAPGLNIYSTTPNHSFTMANQGISWNYSYLSGTSMAAPMVAGVAGLVWQSSHGTSSTSVRSRIEQTADRITGTYSYWMNGRVNAATALGLTSPPSNPQEPPPPPPPPPPGSTTDTTAPSVPQGLKTTSVKFTEVALSWNASSDNVGVAGYNIFRNGTKLGSTSTVSFVDSTPSSGTSYSYTVSAYDTAGNVSPSSAQLNVTTPGAGQFSGKITAAGGVPLANAKIDFDNYRGSRLTLYTDANGNFSTPLLLSGSYGINISKPGYYSQFRYVALANNSNTILNVTLNKY